MALERYLPVKKAKKIKEPEFRQDSPDWFFPLVMRAVKSGKYKTETWQDVQYRLSLPE